MKLPDKSAVPDWMMDDEALKRRSKVLEINNDIARSAKRKELSKAVALYKSAVQDGKRHYCFQKCNLSDK